MLGFFGAACAADSNPGDSTPGDTDELGDDDVGGDTDGTSDTDGDGDGVGGGGGDGDGEHVITLAERTAAATETALNNVQCGTDVLPEGFYWEIGDRDGLLASGSVSGTNTPTPTQVIAIASASKWIYSSYVLEKVGSKRASDIPYLNFTSGHVYPLGSGGKEATCGVGETVGECASTVVEEPEAVGKFFYSAGHFQFHATNTMGIGDLGAVALTTEIKSVLGDLDFTYLQTNLAGGLNTSASAYASFLRHMLRGDYVMADYLGSDKVCASSACAAGAVLSPAPDDEAWNYSLGHWVEDDPVVGDHAFSSAGALGFYPWIDSSKTWYGVLARRAGSTGGSQGFVSLRCGRLIRQAWVTGVAVSGSSPSP